MEQSRPGTIWLGLLAGRRDCSIHPISHHYNLICTLEPARVSEEPVLKSALIVFLGTSYLVLRYANRSFTASLFCFLFSPFAAAALIPDLLDSGVEARVLTPAERIIVNRLNYFNFFKPRSKRSRT